MTEAEFQSFQGFLEQKDLRRALAYLFMLNRDTPAQATVLFHIGYVYRLLKDFDKAERFDLDAIRIGGRRFYCVGPQSDGRTDHANGNDVAPDSIWTEAYFLGGFK